MRVMGNSQCHGCLHDNTLRIAVMVFPSRGEKADARTHQRCYIVEMMGADGGFHALHSCIGGGAHYAALVDPLSDEELARVATAVDRRNGE